jgi:Flp pilus assembly protein TadD/predicted  nucleic acid-binding Zn-ribbon protein
MAWREEVASYANRPTAFASEGICQTRRRSITIDVMKRLSSAVLAAALGLSTAARAEGPDDQYIEIYKVIQEGDQLAGSGQPDLAKQRYLQAQSELKQLQASYPNWNQKLVDFRLHMIETKLGGAVPQPAQAAQPTAPVPQAPARVKAEAPENVPSSPAPPAAPVVTAPTPTPAVPAAPDERDRQIRALQERVQGLEANKTVLEAKLREALAAQPAAVDPREVARAQERIRSVEKEKDVLRVSLELAEAKAARANQAGAAEARKALNEAKQKLAQQDDTIAALHQEKEVLQKGLEEAKRSHEETVRTLTAQNESLQKQLAEHTKPAPSRVNDRTEQELASVKAALQSSRDTVASLQTRLRALEDDRDRLEKTREDLQHKLASASSASASASTADSAQLDRLQKERDDLQQKLNETARELAETKTRLRPGRVPVTAPSEEVSALRARLAALEASKVPYTPEELALFKKPEELPAVVAKPDVKPRTEPKPDAAPLLAEAQHAFAAHRYDEAEKKYQEVLQMDDKDVATLQKLAATQLEQSHPKDAAFTLKRALDLSPVDAHSLLLMGIAQFDQEKYDDALDYLSRSAHADPQNAETQNYLGITLSQKGQRAAAETALRKAVELSPGYASAHYNLAVVYATQKPPFNELARWHYQKALAFGHPQNSDLEKMMEKKEASSQK